MKIFFTFLAATLLFTSCNEHAVPVGNTYYFTQPQPINDSELNSIPNKYLGCYVNADSVFLNVSKKMITEERFFKFRIHKNNLDSIADKIVKFNGKYRFKNETTFLDDKIIGDSIEFSQKELDTFFIFSDKQIAKRINRKLVLSHKDSIYWQSKLVYLNANELVIKYLYSDDDLSKMDSITKIKSKQLDSTSYLISPSRSEFKSFFELKNFGYDQKFKKVQK
jgi:PBP1b-binding outer membrane lipoprotein LpoB